MRLRDKERDFVEGEKKPPSEVVVAVSQPCRFGLETWDCFRRRPPPGFPVVLPVRSKNACGQQGSYPIKLFYTSNMPIILQSALVSNLYFISQLLYRKYSGNFIINLLGKWKESGYSGGQYIPVGGLAYYVTAPARYGSQSIPCSILFGVYAFSLCPII